MTRWVRCIADVAPRPIYLVAEFVDVPDRAVFDAGWRPLDDAMTEDDVRAKYHVTEILRITRFQRESLVRCGIDV